MLQSSLLPLSSESSRRIVVKICQSTLRLFPEHLSLKPQRCENHKSTNANEKTQFVWGMSMVIFLWRRINTGKDVLKLQAMGSSKYRKTNTTTTNNNLRVERTWAEDGGSPANEVRILSVALQLLTQTGRRDLSLYGYFSKVNNVGFHLISYLSSSLVNMWHIINGVEIYSDVLLVGEYQQAN